MPLPNQLPHWRGFNLLAKFNAQHATRFDEQEFRWIADWGFDFVRLPMSYLCWTNHKQPEAADESVLAHIDEAVEWGKRYAVHVCLNLHRAPGYTVARPQEPRDLWTDPVAEEAFVAQWQRFARRYRGLASDRLSFNLLNEPRFADEKTFRRADHQRVMRRTIRAIHQIDPDRLVILDGLNYGNELLPEFAGLPNVAQSCRGYWPLTLTHHQAPWIPADMSRRPEWPMADQEGVFWDRQALQTHYARWAKLIPQGTGIHCGEFGFFNKTPHSVGLAWLRDLLEILRAHRIGWALWNLRGSFGVLDSGRTDLTYEQFEGHQLDGALLQLLRQH